MTEAEKAAAAAAARAAESDRARSVIALAINEAQAPLLKTIDNLTTQIAALIASKGAGAVAIGAQKATNNMGDPTDATRPAITGKSAAAGSGISATRVIKAHLTLKLRGDQVNAETVKNQLKAWGYQDETRAFEDAISKGLSQSVFADGGAVVPQEYSSELIALLRNATVVRKMGATTLPMGASLEIPSQDQAGTAYYVGEGVAITGSQQSFGAIRLAEKKLAALTVVSNDLIRNAVLSAEEFVRNDLVQVMALKEDYQALFGVGGEYSPRGLISLVTASNQYNAVAANQQLPTLAEMRKELAKAVRTAMESNIPMTRMGWVINPRTWSYLWSITDGNGNAVYQAEMASGKLLGHPFLVTNQIPNNLTWSVDGSVDVSAIFFGDWAQFMIGESMAPQVEVFPNAAYDVAGTVVSGISKDQSVIRALQKHDFNARYRNAFCIIKTRMGS
jgi:HK97 family phage major capsid protein